MDSPINQVKQYLNALYSNRYLFIFVAASLSVLIVIGSFFISKKYEAESTVFIERNVINNLMRGLTITPSMSDRIRVLRYYMLSRDMIVRVLKALDKDASSETSDSFEKLVKHCQSATNINLKGDDLFFVSIVDSDPYFARDYINTLVNTYVEENLAAKREESFGANRFLTEQVDFYKSRLNAIEDKINEFRKKAGIFSTVTEASLIDEIKSYEDELKTIQVSKNEMLATVDSIKSQIEMVKNMAHVNNKEGSSDSSTSSEESPEIASLQAKLDELLLVYNEQYPEIIKLRERIDELKKRQLEASEGKAGDGNDEFFDGFDSFNPVEDPIFVDLKMRMNSTQSNLQALQAREKELHNQIAYNKQTLENFPQDKKTLADMERERNMVKNVYESLLERVGLSEVSKQMEVADKATTFRIVDPAILPTVPVGMKRVVLMLLGLLGGIGAGLGAVFIRVQFDDSVKDSDTLRALGVMVLAEIPLMYDATAVRSVNHKNKVFYMYGGICFLFVGLMICHDLLGLDWIDRIIHHMGFGEKISKLVDLIE